MTTLAKIQDLAKKLHARWAWNMFPGAGDVAAAEENLAGVERLWVDMDERTRDAWEDLACFMIHDGFSEELKASGAEAGK